VPVIPYLLVGGEAVDWLWRHRAEVGPFVESLVDRVLARDGTTVDRIGAALVAQSDGQQQVIGLLQEAAGKADHLQAGVDALATGQAVLGQSLSVLQVLSGVGLGATALSQVYLWRQFTRLNRRVDDLGRAVERLQVMIQAGHRADIETGLKQLQQGAEAQADGKASLAEQFLTHADNNLTKGANNFAEQLRVELDRRASRDVLGLIARYLIVAALGEAACQVALGKATEAANALERRLPVLRAYGRRVFEETAGRDPTRFLIPAMATQGVTLDSLAALFRQAALAGIVDGPADGRASELFDRLRGDLHKVKDPWFGVERLKERLTEELTAARAAVEDVNRVQGLVLTIREFDRPGRPFSDLTAMIEREVAARAGGDGFYAYVPPPEGGPENG
jgi:hypothetical protein